MQAQAFAELSGSAIGGQQLVDPAQGQKHFRAWGGELAVAQHGELGAVDPAQIQGLCQGRQHPVGPAVALVPDLDQMGEGNPP